MTTDLTMLVATALLCLGIPFIYGLGRFKQPGGAAWAAGNREKALTVPAWTERAVKAHANLIESLVPFTILVLVAHVSARANSATALGAEIFFWGRVAHLAIYVAGIAYLRTLAWFGSWVGGAIILAQMF